MREDGGASGSVAQPPGAEIITVRTRGRTRKRTNFVRWEKPGWREYLGLVVEMAAAEAVE